MIVTSAVTRRRRRTGAIMVLGAAVALLIGGGLLGQLSDAVRVEENRLQSGEYPLAHDLRIAAVGEADACPDVTSAQTHAVTGITLNDPAESNIDLEAGPGTQLSAFYCLYSQGPRAGALSLSVVDVSDVEVGACTDDEFAVESLLYDPITCDDGEQGELAPVLAYGFTVLDESLCTGGLSASGLHFPSASAGPTPLLAEFVPEAICRLRVDYGLRDGLTDQQLAVAQTDRVTFDLVVTLEDGP